MALTQSSVAENAEEYRRLEPLFAVEQEQIEELPEAFRRGEFGRRDAEWVVRWYFRRYLGSYPDNERRETEAAFEQNDFEEVLSTVEDVIAADSATEKVDRLTNLTGVDVPVASSFLAFIHPEDYIVVGEREWAVLHDAGELEKPYPNPPTASEYETYLDTCRSLADRFDCNLWTLYRALWRLWKADRGD